MNLKSWKNISWRYFWNVKVFGTINKRILAPLNKLFVKGKTQVNLKKWQTAQRGELKFHKESDYRSTDEFIHDTQMLFELFGFYPKDFVSKKILDVGAGSRLRTIYFKGASIIAIEPLLNEFKNLSHFDLDKAEKNYGVAVEEYIPELENQIDFAFSINVLDHCQDFKSSISNIHSYLKEGCSAFFTFDCHYYTDSEHPLILTEEVCNKIFEEAGFTIDKMTKGLKGPYKEKFKLNSYGHGEYCLNYWLTKN